MKLFTQTFHKFRNYRIFSEKITARQLRWMLQRSAAARQCVRSVPNVVGHAAAYLFEKLYKHTAKLYKSCTYLSFQIFTYYSEKIISEKFMVDPKLYKSAKIHNASTALAPVLQTQPLAPAAIAHQAVPAGAKMNFSQIQ